MTDVRPRFEFRVWGEDIDEPAARLAAAADPPTEATTEETYLVAIGSEDVNAKIRGGVFDIKVLETVARGCEQWRPWVKAEFPLPSSLLANEVLPRLGTSAVALGRESYEFEALIAEVVRPDPQLQVVDVSKRRLKYTLGGCIAELADVVAGGHQLRTVAAESEDLDALHDVLRQLGIRDLGNVNYPQALKAAFGWDRR